MPQKLIYGSDRGRRINAEDSGRQMLSFGIYLKVHVARGHREGFRKFPYVEKKRRADEYGEVIDVAISMWAGRGQIMPVEETDEEEAKERKRQEEEASRPHTRSIEHALNLGQTRPTGSPGPISMSISDTFLPNLTLCMTLALYIWLSTAEISLEITRCVAVQTFRL